MSDDTSEAVRQAFDNIISEAWGAASKAEAGALSVKAAYATINLIQAEITKLKQILYTRAS